MDKMNRYIVIQLDGGHLIKLMNKDVTVNGLHTYSTFMDMDELQVIATKPMDSRMRFEERFYFPEKEVIQAVKKAYNVIHDVDYAIDNDDKKETVIFRFLLEKGYEPRTTVKRPQAPNDGAYKGKQIKKRRGVGRPRRVK